MPKKNDIKALLIKVTDEEPTVSFVTVNRDDYKAINDMLEIDIMDIVTRKIGEKYFTIICDDEGLLKDSPIVSAVDKNAKAHLVGNLLICKTTNYGNLKSLTEDDVYYIADYLGRYYTDKKAIPVLMEVDY